MKLSHLGELSLLDFIRKSHNIKRNDVVIGIGDDAAVLSMPTGKLLATTDLMTEGIHFDLSYTTPYQIGFKLVSINVSDIYAMYGEPSHILLSLSFPQDTDERTVKDLLDGVFHALGFYDVDLIGGDLTSSKDAIVVSATLLGKSDNPATRGGARVSDKIYVTGSPGDSACGLELLKKMKKQVLIEKDETIDTPIKWSIMKPLLWRHLMPYVREPSFAREQITSLMDISDGLFIDLKRICSESNVGARIYEERLPVSKEMRHAAEFMGIDPLELCLCGGEDYEYLFTSTQNIHDAQCIGEIVEEGIFFIDRDKMIKEWKGCGYEHFKN